MKLVHRNEQTLVQVNFQLMEVEPDTTNYKQRKPKFFCEDILHVAVEIPIDKEHFANHVDWATYLLSNDSTTAQPHIVLTPIGFECAMQQLAPTQSTSLMSIGNGVADDTDWDSGIDEPDETAKVVEKATVKATATSWDDFEDESAESSSTAYEEKANFETNEEWES